LSYSRSNSIEKLAREKERMAEAVANLNRHYTVTIMPRNAAGASRSPASGYPWAAAEKRLNRFVRAVALVERIGNGLGTLAFTWATVVVLGGFSTDLGQDFWYATTIVFLEAFRYFRLRHCLTYVHILRPFPMHGISYLYIYFFKKNYMCVGGVVYG
jgi:hypothetical protein